jgi:RND family efflux transporter MFP subunit
MKDQSKPRPLRKLLRIAVTLVFAALAGAAVMAGSDLLAQRAGASAPVAPAPLVPVSVRPLRYEEGYRLTRRLVGQVEAGTEAVLSFERGGRLIELRVEEGAFVRAGAVIARLDTAQLETQANRLLATRKATEAQLEFAEMRLKRVRDLRVTGFSSQQSLDASLATRDELRSRVAEIDAALSSVQVDLDKSVLTAPFEGRIGARTVNLTETLGAGQAVVTLIETANPVVRIGLPLAIDPDGLRDVRITIGDATHSATLRQVRPDIDPVTRTRTVLFDVNSGLAPVFGQVATLMLDLPITARGAWVPLDALQEGSGSIWTILVVEDDRVRAAAVELLHVEAGRAYVRGSFPDGVQIVHTGAHRVVPGQHVRRIGAGA